MKRIAIILVIAATLSACATSPTTNTAASCVKEHVAGSAILSCAVPHEAPSAFQRTTQEVVATYDTGRRGD